MNADSFFVQGHTHTVCQDYATAGRTTAPPPSTWPLPGDLTPESFRYTYGILSDGCSTSLNTDFGSRFLVRAAMGQLRSFGSARPPTIVGYQILDSIERARNSLHLPEESLDATLLAAFESGDEVVTLTWGDGVIAARERDTGNVIVHQIEFPTGAPMYLSYWTNPKRLAGYMQKFGAVRKVKTFHPDGSVSESESNSIEVFTAEEFGEAVPVEFRFNRADYDVVAVMSDGVGAFKRRVGHGFQAVPLLDVVSPLMAFKGLSGEFVIRRMRAFLRQAEADGWHWDDDVSMAAVHTGAP